MKIWRIGMVVLLGVSIVFSALPISTQAQSSDVSWWLTGATLKVISPATPPDDAGDTLQLHAARSEFVPFQVVFQAGDEDTQLPIRLEYDNQALVVTVYREQYLAMPIIPEAEIFTVARLRADAFPDGLRTLEGSGFDLDIVAGETLVLWIDVYVQPDTEPGDYDVTIHNGDDTRAATITVYDVDLPFTASMNVLIPVTEYIMEEFAPDGDGPAFHRQVNQLLLDHYIIPGTFPTPPDLIADGWDFSGIESELAQLPPGAQFHTPIPYNLNWEEYYIENEEDLTYLEAHFGDPYFDERLNEFFTDLAAFLESQGRLADALVYPFDETRWVADEPWHDGPRGYERLATWTQYIRNAGLRVRVSGVAYVPLGPPEFGWLETAVIADDTHVHLDEFDVDPAGFVAWAQADPNRSVSVYLNEYGDLIDMPAAIHRGFSWHVYGRGVRDIVGYAVMEWFDERYDFVDPWTEPERLYPHSGYMGGALVWPGPYPSIRLKMLREGVEDARLLDLYATITSPEDAQNFALCLTPVALADQNPTPDYWDKAHHELLLAISEERPIDLATACPRPPTYEPLRVVLDMDTRGDDLDEWEFEDSTGELIEIGDDDHALAIEFDGELPYAGFYLDSQDWTEATALQVHIINDSPYFTSLDVALSDGDGSYLILRENAIGLGPNADVTITMPFIIPIDHDDEFDWSTVNYLTLEVNTTQTQTNAFDEINTFSIGPRRVIFDDFILVK